MASEVARLIAYFGADTADFDRGIGQVKSGLGGAEGSFINTRTVAIGAFTAIGAAAVAGIGKATDMGIKFQSIMSDVQAASLRSADEQAKWSEMVLKASMKSTEGPQNVALAYYDVASAIQDSKAQVDILNAAIGLDNASDAQTAIATIADLQINLANTYGATTEEINRNADVTARMVQLGKGTMGELSSAISPILSLNSQLGVSYEELASSVAYMTTKGMSAAQASTRQEAIISALLKPNAELQGLMKQQGISSFENMIATQGFVGTLQMLNEAVGGSNQELAKLLGTQEAMSGAVTLLNDDYQTFNTTFESGIAGAAGEMQAIKLQDAAVKMDLLKSKVSGLAIAFGSELAPAAGTAIDMLSAGVDFIADLAGLGDEPMQIEVPDPYVEAKTVAVPTTIEYTIQSGDTLWEIAAANDTTVEAILAANPNITNAGMIVSGQTLIIPVDGQIDMNVAMGDLMFAQTDLAAFAGSAEENISRTDRAFDNLEAKLTEISGMDVDLSTVQTRMEELGGLADLTGTLFSGLKDKIDLQGIADGVSAGADSLGIELPTLDEAVQNWWNTSFLNPEAGFDFVAAFVGKLGELDNVQVDLSPITEGFTTVTDTVSAAGDTLDLIVLTADTLANNMDSAGVALDVVATGLESLAGDYDFSGMTGSLGEITTTIQPIATAVDTAVVSFGYLTNDWSFDGIITPLRELQELAGGVVESLGGLAGDAIDFVGLGGKIAPQIDMDEASTAEANQQIEQSFANQKPKIPVALTLGGEGEGGQEAMVRDLIGDQPLQIPVQMTMGMGGEGEKTEGSGAETGVPGLDIAGLIEYQNILMETIGLANSPIELNLSEKSKAEIRAAKADMDALARDREVNLVVNISIGAGREFIGAAVAAGAFALPGRAEGGPVAGNEPYIVGERGPELFVPGNSGRIIPNDQLSGGSGGGSNNFYGPFSFSGINDIEQFYDAMQRVRERRGG